MKERGEAEEWGEPALVGCGLGCFKNLLSFVNFILFVCIWVSVLGCPSQSVGDV